MTQAIRLIFFAALSAALVGCGETPPRTPAVAPASVAVEAEAVDNVAVETDTALSDLFADDPDAAPTTPAGTEDSIKDLFADLPPATPPTPELLEGKVIAIRDGDTITVLDSKRVQHEIRLLGVDCPESEQDYGQKATQAIAKKIHQQQVSVLWDEQDDHGRTLGHVYLGDRWINLEMVQEGWAWHYKYFSDDRELAAAEVEARQAKRGLWADPNQPEPPWKYRRRPRTWPPKVTSDTAESRDAPPAEDTSRKYWLNTSTNVRHNQDCKHYQNTRHGHKCGQADGKACGICGG